MRALVRYLAGLFLGSCYRSRSYYDFWEDWIKKGDSPSSKPEFSLLGSGTDHAAFAFYAGVPSINLVFRLDRNKYKGVGSYPPYHTGYDTFYLVDKILDPGNYSCYSFQWGAITARWQYRFRMKS